MLSVTEKIEHGLNYFNQIAITQKWNNNCVPEIF